MTRVLGIDASCSATGLALPSGRCVTFKPNTTDVGQRLWLIAAHLRGAVTVYRPQIAVVEGYAPHSKGILSTIRLAELGGVVRLVLQEASVPWVEISPSQLKRFSTGSGAATKELVVGAARSAGAEVADDDQADAWWLQAIGLHGVDGRDVEGLPALVGARLDVVGSIDWPVIR